MLNIIKLFLYFFCCSNLNWMLWTYNKKNLFYVEQKASEKRFFIKTSKNFIILQNEKGEIDYADKNIKEKDLEFFHIKPKY